MIWLFSLINRIIIHNKLKNGNFQVGLLFFAFFFEHFDDVIQIHDDSEHQNEDRGEERFIDKVYRGDYLLGAGHVSEIVGGEEYRAKEDGY